MRYEMGAACNANIEHRRKRTENMRIVYGIETSGCGESKSGEESPTEMESEPGHKERFETLPKAAVKLK
jgi:hypothetical protein